MSITTLQPGDKAPDFSAKNQDGTVIKRSALKGEIIALYFYPADLTPTCTVQACNLRDNFGLLRSAGISVIGVSPDGVTKHKKFEEKHDLPFSLLDDSAHSLIDAYGVWGQKQLYGKTYMGLHRTTFIIDKKGIIQHIFHKPKSKEHAQEILEWCKGNLKV